MTGLSQSSTSGRLLPILGVGFGLAVTVGNAIGAGILRAPGEIAGHSCARTGATRASASSSATRTWSANTG